MLLSNNLLQVVFEIIQCGSHLQHLITDLLTVPLLFDGFSNKEISPQQCLQLAFLLCSQKAGLN
jgi:hypothetical protein